MSELMYHYKSREATMTNDELRLPNRRCCMSWKGKGQGSSKRTWTWIVVLCFELGTESNTTKRANIDFLRTIWQRSVCSFAFMKIAFFPFTLYCICFLNAQTSTERSYTITNILISYEPGTRVIQPARENIWYISIQWEWRRHLRKLHRGTYVCIDRCWQRYIGYT